MGRGMPNLGPILNPKSRNSTFKRRKNNLLKKAYELSTLCEVQTCVLIHGPGSAPGEEQRSSEFHTWPPNPSDIEGMIRAYKNCGSKKQKSFNLHDFFSDRKRKMETEVCNLLPVVNELDLLECLSEHELREFMDRLDSKIEAATQMIDGASLSDHQRGNLNSPPRIVQNFCA